MVAAPTNSLPTLSPSDRALLSAYLDSLQDLPALAARLAAEAAQAASNPSVPSCLSASVPAPDYFDLLLWLAQPHIQAVLAANDQAQSRSNRCLAAETIRATMNTCDNDIELRRAATALVRTTLTPPDRARRAGEGPQQPPNPPPYPPAVPPPSAHSPPSPRLDGGRCLEALRQTKGGVPASVEALNGHTLAPAPRTQGLQSLGFLPAHTFTEPVLVPFPRLPHHSPAADLRAKSGAAPPPLPGLLAWLAQDPLPHSAFP